MMEETKRKTSDRMSKLKREYRNIANPKQMRGFLEGQGVLLKRQEVADQFKYDWHSRKLTFETHFRGHVLMQATAYRSTRDHQWAAENDALFRTNGAGVEISVSGLSSNIHRCTTMLKLRQTIHDYVRRLI